MNRDSSGIRGFYKLGVYERLRALGERGLLAADDLRALLSGQYTLDRSRADKMIENVVGVLGLPLGLGMNLSVNGEKYMVPMAVEEPSIVAALGSATKLVAVNGGFTAKADDPILIGQVQVLDVPDMAVAKAQLQARRQEILELANSFHPNMVARGGGARDIECHEYQLPSDGRAMLVVHLLVDTRDAMGANLVNGMCEGVAPLVEAITGGKVFLRILSNLADRSLVTARCRIPVEQLGVRGFSGEAVRDGIMVAADFAVVDPYRAATHNKGIMNGIDPIVLATGNDWRAVEAGAHAYAARGGRYTSLTDWSVDDEGALCGRIELPLKLGTVGGPLESNPIAALSLRLLGVTSATQLAEVIAAAGLAQNLAAMRALATDGIQKGHMTLHARSVVSAAGPRPEVFDTVLERVLESGVIKVWKAQQIIAELNGDSATGMAPASTGVGAGGQLSTEPMGIGYGKVVLLGEHAVVYGRYAIAAPIPVAIKARIKDDNHLGGVRLCIPNWGIDHQLAREASRRLPLDGPAGIILDQLGLADRSMRIEVHPDVPRGMGLGGSAAMAVAIVRALDVHFGLGLADDDVNRLAFEAEKMAHGNPSGVDNTLACYGRPLVYRPGDPPLIEPLDFTVPIPAVVGMARHEGLTAKTVGRVRKAWSKDPKPYERVFDEIDNLTVAGIEAIRNDDRERLGELMNICHGLLNALQVSTPELEQLVAVARRSGAVGAKLTGGGGGGSIVAVCASEKEADAVVNAIVAEGFKAMPISLGADLHGT